MGNSSSAPTYTTGYSIGVYDGWTIIAKPQPGNPHGTLHLRLRDGQSARIHRGDDLSTDAAADVTFSLSDYSGSIAFAGSPPSSPSTSSTTTTTTTSSSSFLAPTAFRREGTHSKRYIFELPALASAAVADALAAANGKKKHGSGNDNGNGNGNGAGQTLSTECELKHDGEGRLVHRATKTALTRIKAGTLLVRDGLPAELVEQAVVAVLAMTLVEQKKDELSDGRVPLVDKIGVAWATTAGAPVPAGVIPRPGGK